jgi:hypothetical protein
MKTIFRICLCLKVGPRLNNVGKCLRQYQTRCKYQRLYESIFNVIYHCIVSVLEIPIQFSASILDEKLSVSCNTFPRVLTLWSSICLMRALELSNKLLHISLLCLLDSVVPHIMFLEPPSAQKPHLTLPTTISDMSQVEAHVSYHVRFTPVRSYTARFRTHVATEYDRILETNREHIYIYIYMWGRYPRSLIR